jgi:hypothetical protein
MNYADVPIEHMSHRERCQWLVSYSYRREGIVKQAERVAAWMLHPAHIVLDACRTQRTILTNRQERRRAAKAARKQDSDDRFQQSQRAAHT